MLVFGEYIEVVDWSNDPYNMFIVVNYKGINQPFHTLLSDEEIQHNPSPNVLDCEIFFETEIKQWIKKLKEEE